MNKKYKNETIETLVPYENIETPLIKVDGLRITRNARLDLIHETKRYARFALKKAFHGICVVFTGIFNVLDELVIEFNKEFSR